MRACCRCRSVLINARFVSSTLYRLSITPCSNVSTNSPNTCSTAIIVEPSLASSLRTFSYRNVTNTKVDYGLVYYQPTISCFHLTQYVALVQIETLLCWCWYIRKNVAITVGLIMSPKNSCFISQIETIKSFWWEMWLKFKPPAKRCCRDSASLIICWPIISWEVCTEDKCWHIFVLLCVSVSSLQSHYTYQRQRLVFQRILYQEPIDSMPARRGVNLEDGLLVNVYYSTICVE